MSYEMVWMKKKKKKMKETRGEEEGERIMKTLSFLCLAENHMTGEMVPTS